MSRLSEKQKKCFISKWIFIFLTVILFCISAHAQQKTADSLKTRLNVLQAQPYSTSRDSSIVLTQYQLATSLMRSDHDTALVLIRQCISLTEKLDWSKYNAKSKYIMAYMMQNTGSYKESNKLLAEVKRIFMTLKDSKDSAENRAALISINSCNISTANNYCYLGEYEKALQIHLASLKPQEQKKDKAEIAACYVNIAMVYGMSGDNRQSLAYSRKALSIDIELKDSARISTIYSNIANALVHENTDEAIINYNLALSIDRKFNNKYGIVRSLNGLGQCYTDKGDFKEALKVLLESNEIVSGSGNKSSSINNLSKIGNCYLKLNKYDEALPWLLKALEKVDENTEPNIKVALYELLSMYYSHAGDFSTAYKYEVESGGIKDSLHNEEVTRQLAETKAKYEYEIKENRLNVEHDKEISKKEQQLKINKVEAERKQAQLVVLTQQNKLRQLETEKLDGEVRTQTLSNEKISVQNNLLLKENELKSIQAARQKQRVYFASAGIAVLLVSGGYVLLLYSKRKKLSDRLSLSLTDLQSAQLQLIRVEKEKEAENIRLRISRDIHDDIGSNLTKIALLSDITATDKKINSPEAIETLGRISDYSRNVNTSLSEIVWAISPGQDTLDSLIVYMRNHIHKFFEDTGIRYEINFPTTVKNQDLNPELKRNIFLVLKESLNNTLKYAEAKNVAVHFIISGDNFELRIKDDGNGFDMNDSANTGNGLSNMKYRMQQSNGIFNIFSSKGNGSESRATGRFF